MLSENTRKGLSPRLQASTKPAKVAGQPTRALTDSERPNLPEIVQQVTAVRCTKQSFRCFQHDMLSYLMNLESYDT